MASGVEHDKVAAGVGFRSQTGGKEGVASLSVVFFPVSWPHGQRKRVVEDVDDFFQSRMHYFNLKLYLLQSLAGSKKVFFFGPLFVYSLPLQACDQPDAFEPCLLPAALPRSGRGPIAGSWGDGGKWRRRRGHGRAARN